MSRDLTIFRSLYKTAPETFIDIILKYSMSLKQLYNSDSLFKFIYESTVHNEGFGFWITVFDSKDEVNIVVPFNDIDYSEQTQTMLHKYNNFGVKDNLKEPRLTNFILNQYYSIKKKGFEYLGMSPVLGYGNDKQFGQHIMDNMQYYTQCTLYCKEPQKNIKPRKYLLK